jgi:hypothetical protein
VPPPPRNPDVSGHRELAAPPEADTVDGGNDRLLKGLGSRVHGNPASARYLLGGRLAFELRDVGSSDECLLARPGNYGYVDGGVPVELLERPDQPLAQLAVQRIHPFRPVDRQDGDAVLNGHLEDFIYRHS